MLYVPILFVYGFHPLLHLKLLLWCYLIWFMVIISKYLSLITPSEYFLLMCINIKKLIDYNVNIDINLCDIFTEHIIMNFNLFSQCAIIDARSFKWNNNSMLTISQ